VLNFFDDTIKHGEGEKAHNENLQIVLKVILDSGSTLRPDKSKFGVTELTFVSHYISTGIRSSEQKEEVS
jgi:hypothetical protein